MKFSMIFEAQLAYPTPERERQVIRDCVDQSIYAEEMGYDREQEAGADEIMCITQMGTIPQSVCMETIRQWGEKVIPHFRSKER